MKNKDIHKKLRDSNKVYAKSPMVNVIFLFQSGRKFN